MRITHASTVQQLNASAAPCDRLRSNVHAVYPQRERNLAVFGQFVKVPALFRIRSFHKRTVPACAMFNALVSPLSAVLGGVALLGSAAIIAARNASR
jgi:hypothetical protein